MNLVVIGGKNFTQHIKVPSYKVNKAAQWNEWEDGNYKKHRDLKRTKISGSFTLLYDDISELDDFFDTVETIQAAHPNGVVPIYLYLNNLHTVELANCFVKYTPDNSRPHIRVGGLAEVEVTVEEQ